MVAELGLTAIEASRKSPDVVPAGLEIVKLRTPDAAPAELAARKAMSAKTEIGVEPLIPLAESVARIVVDPAATAVARPLLPAALLTVAIPVFKELQVTELVRSCVELLL